jgi:WD40 repeat protein
VVVAGGDNGIAALFDGQNGVIVGEPLTGHAGAVSAADVLINRGESYSVLTGGRDGTVRIWTSQRVGIGRPVRGHDTAVTAMAADETGGPTAVVVTGGDDGTVRTWDMHTGLPSRLALKPDKGRITAVAVQRWGTKDFVLAGCGGADGLICVWDLTERKLLRASFSGHGSNVTSLAAQRRPGVFVSAGLDGTIRVWVGFGQTLASMIHAHRDGVTALTLGHVDGQEVVASGGGDGIVAVWDIGAGRCVFEEEAGDGTVTGVALGRVDGHAVVVATSDDGTIRAWDIASHRPLGTLPGRHAGAANAVAVADAGDGTIFLSGGDDQTVRLWDARTLAPVGSIDTVAPVTALVSSGSKLYLACGRGVACILRTRPVRSDRITAVAEDSSYAQASVPKA